MRDKVMIRDQADLVQLLQQRIRFAESMQDKYREQVADAKRKERDINAERWEAQYSLDHWTEVGTEAAAIISFLTKD